jgi:hypothetical protein
MIGHLAGMETSKGLERLGEIKTKAYFKNVTVFPFMFQVMEGAEKKCCHKKALQNHKC